MGRLLDALKRLETQSPQTAEDAAHRESQMVQALDEAEAAIADLQQSLAPQSDESISQNEEAKELPPHENSSPNASSDQCATLEEEILDESPETSYALLEFDAPLSIDLQPPKRLSEDPTAPLGETKEPAESDQQFMPIILSEAKNLGPSDHSLWDDHPAEEILRYAQDDKHCVQDDVPAEETKSEAPEVEISDETKDSAASEQQFMPVILSEAKNLGPSDHSLGEEHPAEETLRYAQDDNCCVQDDHRRVQDDVPAEEIEAKSSDATPKAPDVHQEIARSICSQVPPGVATALFFTSPQDGEGKTEVLCGLVPALLEQTGGRIIVVDANFRRPMLSRRWAPERGPGLGEVLWGTADWSAAVQRSAVEGVDLFPNFGLPKNPDLTARPQGFDTLLQELRKEYSLVLIDAASLSHAETILFAPAADGVYLVVRFGRATPLTVCAAVDVLTQCNSRLWGCIGVGG